MCVTVFAESRQPASAMKRTSIWCSLGSRVTGGKLTAPSVTATAVPSRAPSIQSSAAPSGFAFAESFTVADTVMGVSNGDGDSGETETVVVVARALPSAYIAAMSVSDSVEV